MFINLLVQIRRHYASGPLTCSSRHLIMLCLTSPTPQWPLSIIDLSEKNGSTQIFAVETKRSSKIQDNRGPVNSMAGSAFNSSNLTWKADNPGGRSGIWLTRKSTPYSSNAFDRGLPMSVSKTAQGMPETYLEVESVLYRCFECFCQDSRHLIYNLDNVF